MYIANAEKYLKVYAVDELTAGEPAAYYIDANGDYMGLDVAVDSNTVRWGVPVETIPIDTTGLLVIQGTATLASGGTSGQLVTAIDTNGVITDAAVGDTNADIKVLGISTGADTMFIYPQLGF